MSGVREKKKIARVRKRKARRNPTKMPLMPKSTKEWTEKSASTPERVKNVPYIIRKKTRADKSRLERRKAPERRSANIP